MHACRTCLTKTDLTPLFGDLSAVRFTSKQLFEATGVQIKPNDNLPQIACKSCIKKIKKTLDFQYISSKTNDYLKQIFKNVKIKSELINNTVWNDDDNFDSDFENLDVDKIFVEVKNEEVYLFDNNIDNSHNDNNYFDYKKRYDRNDKNQADNSHNDFKNKVGDNNYFDYQNNFDKNDKSQPYNGNKYLDNEESDINHLDNDQNCTSQSDNNYHSDNSHTDKHSIIDNKLYLDKKNTITQTKRHTIKQITRKTSKNTIKEKQHKKLKILDDKSNSDDLTQKINIKIEDFESDSGNSDIPNNFSNKEEKAIDIKDICDRNGKVDDGIKFMEDKYVKLDKSKRNKIKTVRNMHKSNRDRLMALAITPHSPAGPVQCRVCNEYVKVTSFVMHAKRHFAPEFTCETCGKTFRSHAHMVYHQQRMHGREKRLACSLCDYRTVDRLKLKNHERGHSGERPYTCDDCGATFRMRSNIVQHMRIHSSLRHVQCELCANLFRSRSELANHKNKVHNKLTYLCYLCPQTYKGRKGVQRHLINSHGVNEDQILKMKCVKNKK